MTQMTSQNPTENIEKQDKTNTLAQIVAMRIDELLATLDVKLNQSGNKLVGPCPVHGGNNFGAINLYPEGDTVPGYWKCRTHSCQKVFKPTIIGFVRGVLSHQKFGWQKDGNKMVSFDETINWLCEFIKQDFVTLKVDKAEMERRRFTSQVSSIAKNVVVKEGILRKAVKESLSIPAEYYIKRGYSPDILCKYDVGLCDKQGREMSGRVVVPVYDDQRNLMVGCTGRSIYPPCKECRSYHPANVSCPADKDRWLYSKWKNSKNFVTGSYLYNYWNAKKYIQETATVILVEGPGDVWRLEECGIHNSVALFGCELTDEQQILLESSGAMSVIILLDNDPAGCEAIQKIKETLQRSYNIFIPQISAKDIGDTPCDIVNRDIVPVIKEILLKNKGYTF